MGSIQKNESKSAMEVRVQKMAVNGDKGEHYFAAAKLSR